VRKILFTLLVTITVAASPAGVGFGQKKQAQCEQSSKAVRNWALIDRDYVYFDYVLCPASAEPQNPLVRVWITTRGNGYAVEKWAQDRDGADAISMFHEKKQAYTLYRDLNAVPLTLFKAERRAAVSGDMGRQPFLLEGSYLLPMEKLKPDSVEMVKRAFNNADIIIKKAQGKVALLHEAPRLGALVDSLDGLLKARK
jgi:hypothetical protein